MGWDGMGGEGREGGGMGWDGKGMGWEGEGIREGKGREMFQ